MRASMRVPKPLAPDLLLSTVLEWLDYGKDEPACEVTVS